MGGGDNPIVTVLMSVYNGEKYLYEAINSILNQSYINFEFLIINDGSTDRSKEIILSFNDKRIQLINNATNIGLTKSLNIGLQSAKGKYIARMDADDISLPHRLLEQVKFLENNKDVKLCGCFYYTNTSLTNVQELPETFDIIKIHQFFSNCVVHPSVIFVRDFFKENNLYYDEQYIFSQDYELWTRVARVAKIANISKALIMLRNHDNSISNKNNYKQIQYANEIRLKQIENIGIEINDHNKKMHLLFLNNQIVENNTYDVDNWVDKLKTANSRSRFFDIKMFNSILDSKNQSIKKLYLDRKFFHNKKYNLKLLFEFLKSDSKSWAYFPLKQKIIFIIKCFIFFKTR